MNSIIKLVRQKISKGDHELFGFIEEKNRLKKCVQNVYKDGLSDSVLVIGKKGTGKSHLLRSTLEDLNLDDHFKKNMQCVFLNGLLQTDDRMAIKSIGQQLKVTFDDDENEIMNSQRINDTLSHILKVMSSGHGSNISLLFVIEEFDLFLNFHNQMLVYNLINGVQSIGTSICVIGLTCRLDVVELMEKRVTSRFSRCHIHLTSVTSSFESYIDVARKLLSVAPGDSKTKSIVNRWNKSVDAFLSDITVGKILDQNFLLSNTISRLKLILMLPISRLSDEQPALSVQDLEESWKKITVDYKIEILKGLSIMEFTFVSVMFKCTELREGDINFEMVYREYQTYCQSVPVKAIEKNAMKKCLNNLIDLQLIGVKKIANVSVNYQTLFCFVQLEDLIHCLNCRDVYGKLENYIRRC